ncbi:forkhead box protein R1 [Rhineura floridana]|uniref:forkhead box protein R1 n=1 Tax=Rhineura floridana TaxID=261503 RepID=UPI002AC80C5B|nr:forkhead box protein R1 [Rhineura floridana]
MALHLQKPTFWASLHLHSGLRGWDLGRELALSTTSDQLLQAPAETPPSALALKGPGDQLATERLALNPASTESDEQPHLWMWVNPNLVCPIPGCASVVVPLPEPCPAAGPEDSSSSSCSLACCREELLPLPSEAEKVPLEDAAAQLDRGMWGTRGPTQAIWKAKVLRFRSRKLKRTLGGWPRPPLNYCILISLALSSSVDSSLTVQEIYQFTRQHFPFFRTAPEGWKNTIRHNLCFSSSFEKTTDFVCLEGSRKSRLWKLTMEGRRKFLAETQALPEDLMGLVHESMDNPELMRSLFRL